MTQKEFNGGLETKTHNRAIVETETGEPEPKFLHLFPKNKHEKIINIKICF